MKLIKKSQKNNEVVKQTTHHLRFLQNLQDWQCPCEEPPAKRPNAVSNCLIYIDREKNGTINSLGIRCETCENMIVHVCFDYLTPNFTLKLR